MVDETSPVEGVGIVEHYDAASHEAEILIQSGKVALGDALCISRDNGDELQDLVESMEIEHHGVSAARAGEHVAVKVAYPVRAGDHVLLRIRGPTPVVGPKERTEVVHPHGVLELL